jgi:hypothetical protein
MSWESIMEEDIFLNEHEGEQIDLDLELEGYDEIEIELEIQDLKEKKHEYSSVNCNIIDLLVDGEKSYNSRRYM